MTDYKTDDEKVEELKAWWKENGTSVIAGVALAIAGLFGWEYWKDYKTRSAEAASALYAGMKDNPAQLQALQSDYPSTPYASIASLKAAQQHAEKGEYEPAAAALRWVIDNGNEDYKPLASLRLARTLLAMNKPDEALQLVEQEYPAAWESVVTELKGDVYTAQNKPAEAREAYDRALLTSDGGSTDFIRMKRDNLGEG